MTQSSIHRLIVAVLATVLLTLSAYWDQLPYAKSFFTDETTIPPTAPAPVPSGFERVAHVADGDTITLESGEKVRYIGIDAPELRETAGKSTCYGPQAKAANEALVLGAAVKLVPDKTNRDKYGRLLRYVYTTDGNGNEIFINELLVAQGAAKSYPYKPDTAKQDILNAAQEQARSQGLGLWGTCAN